jgi:membrane associated rhomboid family serine protease
MLEDNDYMRTSRSRLPQSVTMMLLVLNVIIFVLQTTLLAYYEPFFALSLEGLRHGFVWQLLTYQFLHGGPFHILLNCWALYIFGRHVERVIGKNRFLALYFLSGIAGGLLHVVAAFVWPQYFDAPVVGASAGVFGVVSAFAILWPDNRLQVLLFFVIPVSMRARSLLIINLLITAFGIAFPRSFLGGNVAHVAHLGGILMGLAYTRWCERKLRSFS